MNESSNTPRMTLEELLKKANAASPRKKRHDNEEHRIQCTCVRWFRFKYPAMAHALFAVPNGGSRNKIEASNMKAEGVTAGVSDLIFLKSNRQYGALCIEMKKPKGRQSPEQKKWQNLVESMGNKYVICHSLDEFITEIEDFLKNDLWQNQKKDLTITP